MSLDYILLGMLRRPASGYDLKADFEEGGRHFWSAELSQIYPTLQQMQRKGWLSSKKMPSTKGPPRRVYQRTAKGEAALRKWLCGEPILGAERFAYIGQLIFLDELADLTKTLSFLQQLRTKLAAFAGFLKDAAGGVESTDVNAVRAMDSTALHDWISVQLGVRSLLAKVQWCDEAMQIVRDRLLREVQHE